jgi:transposase
MNKSQIERDTSLIKTARNMVNELCDSGGRSWTMRVPVDLERDHDMIFTRLINRFETLVRELEATCQQEKR